MPKEKNNNQKKKEEPCPLCEISKETIRKLKEVNRDKKTEDKSTKSSN